MTKVKFRFVGSKLWDDGDVFPYDVEVPRIPVKGEKITLPDESAWWEVYEVEFDYSNGLLVEPVVGIYCKRPSL